jgi:hypothetical protein
MLNEQYFHVTTTTIMSFWAFEAVQLRIQFFWVFATHHWVFVSLVLRLLSELPLQGSVVQ